MEHRQGTIVVGVDETGSSRAAIDFALREGIAHDATVEVVTAWQWNAPHSHTGTVDEARLAARELQSRLIREALTKVPSRPTIAQVVVHDYPAKALTERADDALMLVIGTGRKSVVTRTLLGSVSEYCVRHSHAPVVVVPEPTIVHHVAPADVEEATSLGVMF